MWKIAEAKRGFSDLVRRAQRRPQVVKRRDEAVVVVVSAKDFEAFREWQAARDRGSLAEALDDLRAIAEAEDYELPLLERADRENPLLVRGHGPRRHQRR